MPRPGAGEPLSAVERAFRRKGRHREPAALHRPAPADERRGGAPRPDRTQSPPHRPAVRERPAGGHSGRAGGRRVGLGGKGTAHDRREIAHLMQGGAAAARPWRSEEHTSELQSLMRISYAVLCLKKKSKFK